MFGFGGEIKITEINCCWPKVAKFTLLSSLFPRNTVEANLTSDFVLFERKWQVQDVKKGQQDGPSCSCRRETP